MGSQGRWWPRLSAAHRRCPGRQKPPPLRGFPWPEQKPGAAVSPKKFDVGDVGGAALDTAEATGVEATGGRDGVVGADVEHFEQSAGRVKGAHGLRQEATDGVIHVGAETRSSGWPMTAIRRVPLWASSSAAPASRRAPAATPTRPGGWPRTRTSSMPGPNADRDAGHLYSAARQGEDRNRVIRWPGCA